MWRTWRSASSGVNSNEISCTGVRCSKPCAIAYGCQMATRWQSVYAYPLAPLRRGGVAQSRGGQRRTPRPATDPRVS